MQTVYLDHAATTPLSALAREALLPYLEGEFGNPSSRHPLGVRAAQALERARGQLARACLVPPRQVVFTSCGTEAANLALLGTARAARPRGRHVIVGPTEHSCVRACAAQLAREGFEVQRAPLTPEGGLDLEGFARLVRPDTVLAAQMLVQNEVGTIYPVARLARVLRARAPGARLVVDAVQAFGKLDCAPSELGADALFLSAHKLGGPKGAGAAVFAAEPDVGPVLFGGGQERGLRAGTENVAAIVGFGAAAEAAERARSATLARFAALRTRLLERLAGLAGLAVLSSGDAQQPGIVALLVPGAPAEVHLHHLARRGVYVGTGSACQANSKELSPALLALGLSEHDVRRVLRVSFGPATSAAEVERGADALLEVSRELERAAS